MACEIDDLGMGKDGKGIIGSFGFSGSPIGVFNVPLALALLAVEVTNPILGNSGYFPSKLLFGDNPPSTPL